MKYVKFSTAEEAEAYKVKLQAHHDATVNVERAKAGLSKIIDCILPVYDGTFALTLHDTTWPETSGEICESVDPPKVEGEEK